MACDMALYSSIDLFGIAADRDIILPGINRYHKSSSWDSIDLGEPHFPGVQKSFPQKQIIPTFDPLARESSPLRPLYSPSRSSVFDLVPEDARLSQFISRSPACSSRNVTSNSSWTSTPSVLDPLERYYRDLHRHEQVALSIPSGVARNDTGTTIQAVLDLKFPKDKLPHIPEYSSSSSTCSIFAMDLDEAEEPALTKQSTSHAMDLYCAESHPHEILAFSLESHKGTRSISAGLQAQTLSPGTPSSISLHPPEPAGAPTTTAPIIPLEIDEATDPDIPEFLAIWKTVRDQRYRYRRGQQYVRRRPVKRLRRDPNHAAHGGDGQR